MTEVEMNKLRALAQAAALGRSGGYTPDYATLWDNNRIFAQAVLDLLEERGWQPIETAPKDRLISLSDEQGVNDGRYLSDEYIERYSIYDDYKDENLKEGWYVLMFNPEYDEFYLKYEPTHWMERIKPPTPQGQAAPSEVG